MGKLALPDRGLVYLDASSIIFSVEKIDPYWTMLQPMWRAAQAGHIGLVSSELALVETLVKPVRAGDTVLESAFRRLLLSSREVRLVAIDRPILESALQLRAATRIKTPDAIHAASGLASGCGLFVTNDQAFRRVPGLAVAVLADLVTT